MSVEYDSVFFVLGVIAVIAVVVTLCFAAYNDRWRPAVDDEKSRREQVLAVLDKRNLYDEGDEVILMGEKLENVTHVIPVKGMFYVKLKDGTEYLTGNANVVVKWRGD